MTRLACVLLLVAGACVANVSSYDSGDDDSPSSSALSADVQGASPARLEAFFQVPLADGTGDKTLEKKVIELAGLAAPGSTVRISMYGWSRSDVAQAFVDAKGRGVNVRVIVDAEHNEADEEDDKPIAADMRAAVKLLEDGLGKENVILCKRGGGSCQGTGIDHNKFYVFSELTDGSKNVVVQASENLTSRTLHNNMIVARDDKDLYEGYLAYWRDMAAQKENLDYYRHADGKHTIAYFFPRAEGDTVISVLDKVKCDGGGKIRIAMAFWNTARIAIADRLIELQSEGCDVRVLTRGKATAVATQEEVVAKLRAGHIKVGLYPSEHGTDIHSKYMLIDAKYDTENQGYVRRKLVYTGSHNYLASALRKNDETLMRVDNADVFSAFWSNWQTIRDQIPDSAFHD